MFKQMDYVFAKHKTIEAEIKPKKSKGEDLDIYQ